MIYKKHEDFRTTISTLGYFGFWCVSCYAEDGVSYEIPAAFTTKKDAENFVEDRRLLKRYEIHEPHYAVWTVDRVTAGNNRVITIRLTTLPNLEQAQQYCNQEFSRYEELWIKPIGQYLDPDKDEKVNAQCFISPNS